MIKYIGGILQTIHIKHISTVDNSATNLANC